MPRPLVIEIFGNAKQFASEMDKAAGKTRRFSKAAGVAGTVLAGGLAVGIVKSTQAAMDAQRVQAQTENQLKALGISYKDHAKRIDEVITSTSKLAAIDDEELQGAFNDLVRSTGNVNKALKDTKLAADLARSGHMSLERATKLIAGAEAGRTRGLQRYVGALPKITTAQDKLKAGTEKYSKAQMDAAKAADENATKQAALAAVHTKTAGAAEAYGKTAQGAQDRMRVSVENLEESLGKLLLPAVEKVSNAIAALADFMEAHKTTAKVLAVGLGVLATALIAVSVATKLASLALLASPWGAVAIAIAALVAGIIIAIKHWDQIKQAMSALWSWIKDTFLGIWDKVKTTIVDKLTAVKDWIKDHWVTLVVGIFTGLPGLLVKAVIDHWGEFKAPFEAAFNGVKSFFTGLVGDIAGFFKGLPGRIGNAIGGAIGDLSAAIAKWFSWKRVLGWVKDALDWNSPMGWAVDTGKAIVHNIADGVGQAAGVLKDAVFGLAKKFAGSVVGGGGGLLDKAVGAAHAPYAHGLSSQVNRALSYASSHGWHGSVISGFRTRQEQEALYARYVASGYDPRYIAARPGTSSHESGNAVDVSDAYTFDRIMASAPYYARLMNNVPGDFGHFSVSGRAAGGAVAAGQAYMVGEQGPELFVPNMGGEIVPKGLDFVRGFDRTGNLLGASFTKGLRGAITTQTIKGPIMAAKAAADQFVETTGVDNMTGAGEMLGDAFQDGLSSSLGVTPAGLGARSGLAGPTMTAQGPGSTVHVTVNGSVMTERDLSVAIRDQLQQIENRSGRIFKSV